MLVRVSTLYFKNQVIHNMHLLLLYLLNNNVNRLYKFSKITYNYFAPTHTQVKRMTDSPVHKICCEKVNAHCTMLMYIFLFIYNM